MNRKRLIRERHQTPGRDTPAATHGTQATIEENRRSAEAALPGNLSMQRLLQAGLVQPRLEVGAPDDPYEKEADRVADRVVQRSAASCSCGNTCPKCLSHSGQSVQRSVDHGSRRSRRSAVSNSALNAAGSGSALGASERRHFESEFGRDFSDVRIHTDAVSARLSREIQAHAFTSGRDIFFSEGRYQPHTTETTRLLAHELTHVVQQDAGHQTTPDIQRNGFGDLRVAEARAQELEIDPCDVQEGTLTNESLILQLHRTRTYIKEHKRSDDDYFAFANLLRRLAEERHKRMEWGHLWLGEDLHSMPGSLYRLSTGSFNEIVVEQYDVQKARGIPTINFASDVSIVTPSQFDHFLSTQNIPTVDAEQYFRERAGDENAEPLRVLPPLPAMPRRRPEVDPFGENDFYSSLGIFNPFAPTTTVGISGGSTYISPFDLLGHGQVSNRVFTPGVNMSNPRSVTGARSRWRGALPEAGLGSQGYGLLYRDLNAVQANFPIFDFRSRLADQYISVKSVVPTNPADAPNFSTYENGFDDMVGLRRPTTMNRAVTSLNTAFGTTLTSADIVSEAYLAVNLDHVDGVRDTIEARVRANPGNYIQLFDSLLQTRPIEVGGVRYNTWVSLQTLSASDLSLAVDSLARQSRGRVIDNGFTTTELRNMQTFRESFQNLNQPEFARLAGPELIEAERFGGGVSGTRMAMRQAMLRGGGQGLVLTGGLDILRYAFDPKMTIGDLGEQLVIDVPLGGAGAAGASAIESRLNIAFSRSLLAEASASGAASISTATPLLGRGFSGGVGAGITAPAVTMAAMGLQELFFGADFAYSDYLAKAARTVPSAFIAGAGGSVAAGLVTGGGTAAVAGGGGGALAAGGGGAIGGSWAPVIGTAIGFVVGVGLYFAADAIWGEEIEEEVKLALGQGGCPRPEPTEPVEYPPDYMMWP